jgi:hypothetical protein
MIRPTAFMAMAALALGCRERIEPARAVPANLSIVTNLPATGTAGSIAGTFVVRVTDASSQPLSGVLVHFGLTVGGGAVSPVADTTGADGTATTTVRLSTVPGVNEVSALVAGLPLLRSAAVTGSVAEARTLTLSARILRFSTLVDSLTTTATPRDEFGNVVSGEVAWTSRNPALVTISPRQQTTALARVIARPGQTYLVASIGTAADSILVAVHDASTTPCTFIATPSDLPLAGSLSFESGGPACVRSAANAEYAVIGHYNSAITSGQVNLSVAAQGVVAPAAPFPGTVALRRAPTAPEAESFEAGLRRRERDAVPGYVAGARAWFDARRSSRVASLSMVTREGDLTEVNVNPFDFCTRPTNRPARVRALSPGTVILEDTSNPAGGFSDDEYRSLAAIMDTLVMPVDTAAFGAPTDIDGNGRIGILFTRSVNELTPRGSNAGVVLGFYYARDLLPRVGASEECPGSNAGEMFYVLVPDPDGAVSDPRSTAFVQSVVIGTIAHELQHLINASRRMYVNRSPSVSEEPWLNEGLSHIAEELLFYRTSGLGSRQNIGADALAAGTVARQMHDTFMRGNFGRFSQYLRATDSNSPLAGNDLLATRGASWALLRYIADRTAASDGDLWRRLVNSRQTGVVNLDAELVGTGLTTLTALQDWSLSAITDDLVPGAPPALTQPSWNFATAMPLTGFAFGPAVVPLVDGLSTVMSLRAGGSMYVRFAVAAGREALVQVTSGGGVAPSGVRLTIVRIK